MPSKKKPTSKKTTAKKPPASAKRVTKKSPAGKSANAKSKAKVKVPPLPPSAIPADEQGFHTAIKNTPDDLTVHLVYADWLAEHGHESRATVLRAWTELVRTPVAAGMSQLLGVYQRYQDTLLQKDAEWIEAMEKLRRWISRPIAEKIVRVFIDSVFGRAPAET